MISMEQEMKGKKIKFRRNILFCVYGFLFVCILCGVIVWISCGERHFSYKKWINCDPAKRYLYIENFEEQYNVIGMNRYEIEDLLGSPTWTITEPYTNELIYYEYRIQDHLIAGWKVFQLSFQDDVVVGTTITVEDW